MAGEGITSVKHASENKYVQHVARTVFGIRNVAREPVATGKPDQLPGL